MHNNNGIIIAREVKPRCCKSQSKALRNGLRSLELEFSRAVSRAFEALPVPEKISDIDSARSSMRDGAFQFLPDIVSSPIRDQGSLSSFEINSTISFKTLADTHSDRIFTLSVTCNEDTKEEQYSFDDLLNIYSTNKCLFGAAAHRKLSDKVNHVTLVTRLGEVFSQLSQHGLGDVSVQQNDPAPSFLSSSMVFDSGFTDMAGAFGPLSPSLHDSDEESPVIGGNIARCESVPTARMAQNGFQEGRLNDTVAWKLTPDQAKRVMWNQMAQHTESTVMTEALLASRPNHV
eukprot:COSAG01_NODE_2_length_63927_cov_1357.611941_3_plen_289_part_00